MVEEIKRQYPNWPSILQDETRNDLTILNNSPTEDFTIGDRKGLMAALDIIKKAGEFQAQINQGYMVKELPDGSEAMFAVIYMGLAQGYYFSEDLGLAGSIVFNGDQWVWKDDRKLLQSLISMSEYLRGNQQAALVELPLELNTDREGGTE
jgi:hypothetical protein